MPLNALNGVTCENILHNSVNTPIKCIQLTCAFSIKPSHLSNVGTFKSTAIAVNRAHNKLHAFSQWVGKTHTISELENPLHAPNNGKNNKRFTQIHVVILILPMFIRFIIKRTWFFTIEIILHSFLFVFELNCLVPQQFDIYVVLCYVFYLKKSFHFKYLWFDILSRFIHLNNFVALMFGR